MSEVENTVETTTGTEVDYKSLYEAEQERAAKAEERAIGAEKMIEKHKKKKTESSEQPVVGLSEEKVAKMMEETLFYKSNPDLVQYKDQISEYTSKGIDMDDAVALVERKDPTISNRKVAQKSNFTSGDTGGQITTYTQEETSKMDYKEYAKVFKLYQEGKVKIV